MTTIICQPPLHYFFLIAFSQYTDLVSKEQYLKTTTSERLSCFTIYGASRGFTLSVREGSVSLSESKHFDNIYNSVRSVSLCDQDLRLCQLFLKRLSPFTTSGFTSSWDIVQDLTQSIVLFNLVTIPGENRGQISVYSFMPHANLEPVSLSSKNASILLYRNNLSSLKLIGERQYHLIDRNHRLDKIKAVKNRDGVFEIMISRENASALRMQCDYGKLSLIDSTAIKFSSNYVLHESR